MSQHKYNDAYNKGFKDGKKKAFDGWVEQCYDELPPKEQIELLMKQGAKLPTVEPQRIECGTDGNLYKMSISNGKEFSQTVEPQEWISVKDSRKPKVGERVLVTDCDEEVWMMKYNDCDTYFNDFGDVYTEDIVAWKPLPTPYKEEEE